MDDAPRGASSASTLLRSKMETTVKKEEPHSPSCGCVYHGRRRARLVLPPDKKWWKVELEMQAAYRVGDDPEDALGHRLLLDRSFNEDIPTTTDWHAEWWLVFDNVNTIDLDGGAPT
jgi:hypothetical protein